MSFWLDSVPEFAREQLKSWGLEEKSRGVDLVLRILSYPVLPPKDLHETFSTYRGPKGHFAPIRCVMPARRQSSATIVLLHGATPAADYHPGMLMIARVLASGGYRVLVPQVPPLKRLRITEESSAWLLSFQNWMLEDEETSNDNISWVAMSFGGTLLLKTTLEQAFVECPPRAILTYGSFCNLESTYDYLLSGLLHEPDGTRYQTPHAWGKIVVFLNYLHRIDAGYDTRDIESVLRQYEYDDEVGAQKVMRNLSASDRAICTAIIDSESTPELERLLDLIRGVARDDILNLSPEFWGDRVTTKVYVMHGMTDSMVPYTEALALHRTLPASQLFVSDLAKHSEVKAGALSRFEVFSEMAGMARFLGEFVSEIARDG